MAKDINFKTSTKETLSDTQYFFDVSERMSNTLSYIKKQLTISADPTVSELKKKASLPLGRAFSTKKIKKDIHLRRGA
jgi:hypothetical protein